jgi:GDPmannose 4,6-dehydratase
MGNLQAKRDWGYAGDHVEAMWRMLQAETPEDYVIGTGQLHSVEQLVAAAFACVDLNWTDYVNLDPKLIRADEHFHLVANPAKARRNLNWEPQVSFEALIQEMVLKDLERLKSGAVTPAAP